MKVVVTGGTGFVGGEVVRQLLSHASHTGVEAVTALVRRPLSLTHPRLRTVVHADFAAYDEPLLASLADHGACIWTLGGKASDFASSVDYARVTHGFTLALARGLASRGGDRVFCYLSGMGADPSESSALPWERETRHLKGRTEKDLGALAREHARFAAYAFRPGGILPVDGRPWVERLLGRWVVRVDVLARAMIDVALRGHAGSLLDNAEIKRVAAAVPSVG